MKCTRNVYVDIIICYFVCTLLFNFTFAFGFEPLFFLICWCQLCTIFILWFVVHLCNIPYGIVRIGQKRMKRT